MGDTMNYVTRSMDGTVVSGNELFTYKQGIKSYINSLCLKNLSTFEGREKASAYVLNHKSNLPLYINENIVLFPTESLRNYECVYINYLEILSVQERDYGLTKFIFNDLSELNVNITHSKMKKQMKRALTIYEYKKKL